MTLDTAEEDSVMIFTLLGDIYVGNEYVEEKTAVRLTPGTSVHFLKTWPVTFTSALFTLKAIKRIRCLGRANRHQYSKRDRTSFHGTANRTIYQRKGRVLI